MENEPIDITPKINQILKYLIIGLLIYGLTFDLAIEQKFNFSYLFYSLFLLWLIKREERAEKTSN